MSTVGFGAPKTRSSEDVHDFGGCPSKPVTVGKQLNLITLEKGLQLLTIVIHLGLVIRHT